MYDAISTIVIMTRFFESDCGGSVAIIHKTTIYILYKYQKCMLQSNAQCWSFILTMFFYTN